MIKSRRLRWVNVAGGKVKVKVKVKVKIKVVPVL
jgi:hypothetical protein